MLRLLSTHRSGVAQHRATRDRSSAHVLRDAAWLPAAHRRPAPYERRRDARTAQVLASWPQIPSWPA